MGIGAPVPYFRAEFAANLAVRTAKGYTKWDAARGVIDVAHVTTNVWLSNSHGGNSDGETVFNQTENSPATLDAERENHILNGEPNGGGGHRFGTGRPGKSEFPESWSDDRIKLEVVDIANDPKTQWSLPDSRNYVTSEEYRGGVRIKVVKDMNSGRIITAYPTNLPRNPK